MTRGKNLLGYTRSKNYPGSLHSFSRVPKCLSQLWSLLVFLTFFDEIDCKKTKNNLELFVHLDTEGTWSPE